MALKDESTDAPKVMRRTRVLSNIALRTLARALVQAQPHRLGQVSAAYEGVFRMRPCGLSLKYKLGPQDAVGNALLWCGPGMRSTLERYRPALIFECLPTAPSGPIETLLGEWGYRLQQLTPSGPVSVGRLIQDHPSDQYNYLATPRERQG